MAQRRVQICLALALVTTMWAESWAQPNPTCMPAVTSLFPCLSFLMGSSSVPQPFCCVQLAIVAQTQAQCLCPVLNGAPQLPFFMNQTQALALPAACKIQTSPFSQCNAASGSAVPTPAPASAETPSTATAPLPSTPSVPSGTPTTPATPSVPSIPSAKGGSKTGLATSASSFTSSSTKFTLPVVLVLIVASVLYGF